MQRMSEHFLIIHCMPKANLFWGVTSGTIKPSLLIYIYCLKADTGTLSQCINKCNHYFTQIIKIFLLTTDIGYLILLVQLFPLWLHFPVILAPRRPFEQFLLRVAVQHFHETVSVCVVVDGWPLWCVPT